MSLLLGMSELTAKENRASGTALEELNCVVCYHCATHLINKNHIMEGSKRY